MTAVKSIIITLPAKNLSGSLVTKTTPSLVARGNLSGSKMNFQYLMDKVKLEFLDSSKLQNVKHMEESKSANVPLVDISSRSQENIATVLPVRGKKRRLDHLSWEEKLQRKKLKNRVAAQTSRDRKKERLDKLQETNRILVEQVDRLLVLNNKLKMKNDELLKEVNELKAERDLLKDKESCRACVDCAASTLGSAVSPMMNPLQKGGVAQKSTRSATFNQTTTIILKILMFYLFSKKYSAKSQGKEMKDPPTSSKISMGAFCKSLPREWKQVLLTQVNRIQSKKKSLTDLAVLKKWGSHQVISNPIQPREV